MRRLDLALKAYSIFIAPRKMYIASCCIGSPKMGRVSACSPAQVGGNIYRRVLGAARRQRRERAIKFLVWRGLLGSASVASAVVARAS